MLDLVKLYFYLWQKNRHGFILIISSWILIILSFIMITVSWRIRRELNFIKEKKDRLKAYYLAKAGISCVISQLEDETTTYLSLIHI
ncbi:MAG: hypothetical protein N2Z79_01045, partial [Candidatus Omnitrophica bacterium]|nr:hypothetical protein [Candidatus Omnitrophota bacterium]